MVEYRIVVDDDDVYWKRPIPLPKNRQEDDDRSRVPAPPKWIVRMVIFELCVFFPLFSWLGLLLPVYLPMYLNVSLDISSRLLFTRSNDVVYEMAWIPFDPVQLSGPHNWNKTIDGIASCGVDGAFFFGISNRSLLLLRQHHQNVFGDLLHTALDIRRELWELFGWFDGHGVHNEVIVEMSFRWYSTRHLPFSASYITFDSVISLVRLNNSDDRINPSVAGTFRLSAPWSFSAKVRQRGGNSKIVMALYLNEGKLDLVGVVVPWE